MNHKNLLSQRPLNPLILHVIDCSIFSINIHYPPESDISGLCSIGTSSLYEEKACLFYNNATVVSI